MYHFNLRGHALADEQVDLGTLGLVENSVEERGNHSAFLPVQTS